MSNKQKHDWTVFTDPESSLDLYGKSVRKSLSYDSYAGKTVFKARALTDMFPLTANQLMAIDGGATGNESGANKRHAFKARIIGANSPHSFLPDVCDPAYASDTASTYQIISMHTTFISTDLTLGVGVTRGDIVTVELKKSGQTYELEYGRFLKLSARENPGDAAKTECFALKDLVGGWAPNEMGTSVGAGGAVGSTSEPRPEYPPCNATHGITKKWIETPISEFAKTVKAQVTDQTLAIAIIAVAIQEQGKGSNITGYNYNRYGIMADLRGSWGTGKIKCSVPSTEGASGTGNRREKNRWFAAFVSEADGIDFMAAALRAKGFDKATDAETFVKLHIDKWLSPSNKKIRIESTESKWVNYRKKKQTHWTNAKTYYDKVV